MVRKLKKSYIGVVKKFATGGKFLLIGVHFKEYLYFFIWRMKKSFARYSHYNMNTEQMFAQATGYYNYDKIEMTHEFYQKDNDMTLTNFNITDETNWQNIY